MNTTRAWDKEKSESLWIEPMTSRTPGERSLHWATRTHGDPSSMQDACHTWTQLNGLVRLLSGTQIFSLPHAGVMLVSSLFTRLFLFFFFRRAPEISLKPEENRREELYYSDQYHSDPDAEEPLLSHKTNSPSYSAIWNYKFFTLLSSFQFCSHGNELFTFLIQKTFQKEPEKFFTCHVALQRRLWLVDNCVRKFKTEKQPIRDTPLVPVEPRLNLEYFRFIHLSERIITRTSFCWVPWINTYFMASRGVPDTTFKRSKIVFNLSISVSNDF